MCSLRDSVSGVSARTVLVILVSICVGVWCKQNPRGPGQKDGEMQDKLLKRFGLPTVPKPSGKKDVPDFLYQMYYDTVNGGGAVSGVPNTIRTYFSNGGGRRGLFTFKLTNILESEKVLRAEIKLFLKRLKNEKYFRKFNSVHSSYKAYMLFHVLERESGKLYYQRQANKEPSTIEVDHAGWVTFDISKTVLQEMTQFKKRTYKFRFSVELKPQPRKNFTLDMINRFKKLPVKFIKRRTAVSESNKLPILVLYINDTMTRSHRSIEKASLNKITNSVPANVQQDSHSVSRRSSGQDRRWARRSAKKRRPSKMLPKKTLCNLYEYTVNFFAIGWNSWIIAPPQYKANICYGKCQYPLGQHYNATNHAVVQSILNNKQLRFNKTRPRFHLSSNLIINLPCCVPDQLTSIHVLYYDELNNVIIKEFDDMAATQCGCY